MIRMKLATLVALAGISLSSLAFAQSAAVTGTVEKVDLAQGKITLNHGPIKNLEMDAMTMVFRAQDPAMLKSVKQGDKVQFDVEQGPKGLQAANVKKI